MINNGCPINDEVLQSNVRLLSSWSVINY